LHCRHANSIPCLLMHHKPPRQVFVGKITHAPPYTLWLGLLLRRMPQQPAAPLAA
jgi:hypothetical protein